MTLTETLEDILEVVTHEQMDELFEEDPSMEADLARLAREIMEPELSRHDGVRVDESLNYVIDLQDQPTVEVVIGFYMEKLSRDDIEAQVS